MNTTSEVKERPILFSGEMVRAILDGRKTQTRRLVKPQPPSPESVRAKAGDSFHLFTDQHGAGPDHYRVAGPVWAVRELLGSEPVWRCPYGAPGDRLWVRETWAVHRMRDGMPPRCIPSYDVVSWLVGPINEDAGRWRPSIHMPRWASRITLEITDVRVERLQDITDADARAEGVKSDEHLTPTQRFRDLWEYINGIDSWGANPWVWVIQFRRMEK